MMGTGTTSAIGTSSLPAGLPPNPYAQMGTAALAGLYVTNFLATPVPPTSADHSGKNPNVQRVGRYILANRDVFNALAHRTAKPEEMQTAVRAAVEVSDSYDAGFCMGILDAAYRSSEGSLNFRDGLSVGQFHRSSRLPVHVATTRYASAGFMIAGAIDLVGSIGDVDAYRLARFCDIYDPMLLLAGGAFVYGIFSRFSKSAPSDAEVHLYPAERFHTTGPYAYHRYPYDAAIGFGAGIVVSGAISLNSISSNPSLIKILATAASFAVFLATSHMRVIRNEKALRRLHGSAYHEYEKRTPRYLPDLWGIGSKLLHKFLNPPV